MATLKQIENRADELGAEVICEDYGISVYSPRGKVWADSLASVLAESFRNNGGQSWKPKAFGEILERMQMGLEDADEDESGYWWEDED